MPPGEPSRWQGLPKGASGGSTAVAAPVGGSGERCERCVETRVTVRAPVGHGATASRAHATGTVFTPLGSQDAQPEGEGGAFVGGGMMVERPARWMPPERLVGLVVLADCDLEWSVG